MAGNIAYHPAPGLGELLPGWYDVPQNPIAPGAAGVRYTPTVQESLAGLGEFIGASFVVPQNPIKDYVQGNVKPIGTDPNAPGVVNGSLSGVGCGCACGGGSCSCGGGMGDISSDLQTFSADLGAGDYMKAIMDPVWGVPIVIWVGALWFLFAGTGQSRAGKAVRTVRRKVTA